MYGALPCIRHPTAKFRATPSPMLLITAVRCTLWPTLGEVLSALNEVTVRSGTVGTGVGGNRRWGRALDADAQAQGVVALVPLAHPVLRVHQRLGVDRARIGKL